MLVFRHINTLQAHLKSLTDVGLRVGFVPTMGALHDGHLSLLSESKSLTDICVVSVYVNPTQFDDGADFAAYPREVDKDLALLDRHGCDIVWLPTDEGMYPTGREVAKADYGALTNSLEGHFRPGHFDGMIDIVRKLLNTVKPHVACFGEKDFQQLAIIRELVKRELIDTKIVGCPIVREESGLARSSRNERLSAEQRASAAQINVLMRQAGQMKTGSTPTEVMEWLDQSLTNAEQIEPVYARIVQTSTLEQPSSWAPGQQYRLLVAAFVGSIRLIDNMPI